MHMNDLKLDSNQSLNKIKSKVLELIGKYEIDEFIL